MKKLLGLFLCAMMALSMTACASGNNEGTQTPSDFTFADTVKWDAEYDVVVAGFGGAGAMASSSAAQEGAKVLLVEKMPQGQDGGNTKVCGQFFAYGNGNVEETRKYYKSIAGDHQIPEDVLETIVNGVANMKDTFINEFGVKPDNFKDFTGAPVLGEMSPEYPWAEGASTIGLWKRTDDEGNLLRLYDLFQEQVFKNSDNIDIWYASPATELIQDPVSKTIVGVRVERNGETLNVHAKNGVVLTTGGFEANPKMVADYLGLGDYAAIGGQYNTGDGVRMAMEVGADLWHMEVYEGGFFNGALSMDVEIGTPAVPFPKGGTAGSPIVGSAFTVGEGGKRYFPEDVFGKHGHFENNGIWSNLRYPEKSYLICDKAYMDGILANENRLSEFQDDIVEAATLEELAEKTGIELEGLKQTFDKFNKYAAEGNDVDYGRAAKTMAPLAAEGPYYSVYLVPTILNTQGGPRKNGQAEVLDTKGNPIPHLYVAGELGGLTSSHYQGGTNIAECITFGRLAGKNAAAAKDPLPAYEPLKAVESTPAQPGEINDNKPQEAVETETKENEYIGVGEGGMGGDVTVKVTMDGDKIASVEVIDHKETEGISDPAIEGIPAAIVEAQSTEVDNVSGATMTSTAIKNAVNDALSQIK